MATGTKKAAGKIAQRLAENWEEEGTDRPAGGLASPGIEAPGGDMRWGLFMTVSTFESVYD